MTLLQTIAILDKKQGIEIGHAFLLERLTVFLQSTAYHKVVLITEMTVASVRHTNGTCYFDALCQLLQKQRSSKQFASLVIDTKPIKSRANRDAIENALLEFHCGRDTLLIALGGGSLTDMVGFVAACFNRGIAWLAIPTTLLSIVDASIGGKTGLDLPGYGKNVIGAIWHPEKILVELDFLDTLPPSLWIEGWAEMLKLSLISNKAEFESFECLGSKTNWPSMWQQEPDWIQHWIIWCIQKKAAIVSGDPRECHDARILLNFGHTIGHALESHFSQSHGEAVAHGMYYESQLSYLLGHLSESQAERVKAAIEGLGWPKCKLDDVAALLPYLKRDKKSRQGAFKMVLLQSIGVPIVTWVDEQSIHRALAHAYKLAKFHLSSPSQRRILVPGSKSMTNRAILLTALRLKDPTESITLTNVLVSDDTMLMMQALKTLQLAAFEWTSKGHLCIRRPAQSNKGLAPTTARTSLEEEKHVYVGNAGTVVRFLIPVCCLSPRLAQNWSVVIESSARMAERPFAQILECMNAKQAGVLTWIHATPTTSVPQSHVPIMKIVPFAPDLSTASNVFEISPFGSSQFISGLLMALASLETPSVVLVTQVQRLEDIPSYPFIQMTLDMIHGMHVGTVQLTVAPSQTALQFSIQPTAASRAPGPDAASLSIEPDLTSTSYPLAFAMMTETELVLPNMSPQSCQGDKAFIDTLAMLGASVEYADTMLYFRGSLDRKSSHDLRLDLTHSGDTFMTLAVLSPVLIEFGCAASVRLTGLRSQNSKECERVRITMEHLQKCGVSVSMTSDCDELWIQSRAWWEGQVRIDPHQDHRIAMSFSLLGAYVAQTAARCDRMSLVIDDIETTRKTWPQYWHQMSEAFGWSYESA